MMDSLFIPMINWLLNPVYLYIPIIIREPHHIPIMFPHIPTISQITISSQDSFCTPYSVVIPSGASQHGGGTPAIHPGSQQTNSAHRRGARYLRCQPGAWKIPERNGGLHIAAGKIIGRSWKIMGT